MPMAGSRAKNGRHGHSGAIVFAAAAAAAGAGAVAAAAEAVGGVGGGNARQSGPARRRTAAARSPKNRTGAFPEKSDLGRRQILSLDSDGRWPMDLEANR